MTFVVILYYLPERGRNLKKRLGINLANIILISIVGFLAIDIGSSLYNPDRLNAVLPFSVLKVIGGDIQVQGRYTLAWEKAVDGITLEPGSRVRTDPDGYASLSFFQGTTAKLEPGTDVIISKLENDAENQFNGVTLRQQSGKTWNQVARLADDSYHFLIETPSADIKVQGTLFATEVDGNGKTTVQTTEGSVSVSAQGKEVQVTAGQQTMVVPGEAPCAPAPILPPGSEMVLTIAKATGLVTDPSGSSTGYLPDGTPMIQIIGSQLSKTDDDSQVIRIPEPEAGHYNVELNGINGEDASVSVEAYAEGKPALYYTDNVTTESNLMLKLHLDVLNGLLGNADEIKPAAGPKETQPSKPKASKPVATEEENTSWFGEDRYIDAKWIIIGGIAVILVGLLVIVWKKM